MSEPLDENRLEAAARALFVSEWGVEPLTLGEHPRKLARIAITAYLTWAPPSVLDDPETENA